MKRPGCQHGLGMFEFIVVMTVIAILAYALLERLLVLEQETERLEVALTVRHIHIGLKLAIGEHLMHGEEARIPELVKANPLHFLGAQKVGAGDAAPGNWQFDHASATLSYRPRQPEAFDGRTTLVWRLTAHLDELGRTSGLRLEPLK